MVWNDEAAVSAKSRFLPVLWFGLIAAGGLALVAGAAGSDPGRAWQAYLVNFVFWTGLAAGAVLLSAVLTLTGARWAGPIQRLSECFAPFLPVSCLLLVGLWPGKDAVFSTLASSPPARQVWLNPVFLFPRDVVALAFLAAAGIVLALRSRDMVGGAHPTGSGVGLALRSRKLVGGAHPTLEVGWAPPTAPAVLYSILYALVLSLLGFDWIMALDPHWMSTLFGAYYFVGSFYTGLAAVAVLTGLFAARLEIRPAQTQDLGTLLLGFAFTTGYLFFVQFLVIWFANVASEAHYLILRLRTMPWVVVSRTVLATGFCIPVAVLLFRRVKASPGVLAVVGAVALVGMWLERFVLVAPSLSAPGRLPLGLTEALISAGFFGLVAGCVHFSLRRLPPAEETP